ncbi:MAG: PKD domain-containing protein [Bacteroidia bacterium]|nr:PKD domain-containing protein [Bacteroidia bacterium]
MKHLFTLLVGLCLIPFITNGQTLLDENFATGTGTTPPTGWTQTTIAGDPTFDTWRFNNPGNRTLNAPISSPAAIFDSDNYSSAGGAEDVVLTSPVFSGVGVTSIILTFDHYFQGGFGGAWSVDVFNGTAWVSVISGTTTTTNPKSETVDISTQAAGVANAQVRLHWTGDYSWYWIVDNVKVVAPILNNVGIASVNQPEDGCGLSATETVSVTIQNFGLATQTSVPVAFSVNGGTPVMETYTGSIAPGATASYTFTGTADFSTPGVYNITAYTMLAGDGDLVNDTTDGSAEHFTPITLPISENFDAYATGVTVFPNFTNEPSGTVLWQVRSGGTPSGPTGPTGDKNGPGKYIYIESSGAPLSGWKGKLLSDCIDLSSAIAPNLIFSYHMVGTDIDSFEVEIISGGTTTNILKLYNQQQTAEADPYITDTLNLAAYIGSVISVRFTASVSGFLGDVALDEISVKDVVPVDLATIDVQLPEDGCGLSDSSDVTITVRNDGTQAIGGFAAAFAVDGGPIITPEIVNTLLNPGATYTYTFIAKADLSAVGPHFVGAGATTVGDQVAANDTVFGTVTHIPTISTYPYFEDFEGGNGAWIAGGTASSWVLGTPAKTVIIGAASGSNSWVTGGLGTATYNPDESSSVVSPCFDMSGAPANASVALKIWWESEFSWDGAVLQSTNDDGTTWTNIGGLGDPNNWYTDGTINGAPGGQQTGWTGRVNTSNGSNGWRQAQHALDSAVIGQSQVRFRIAFGADGSVHDDGFAFDDFAIGVPPQLNLGPDSLKLCIGEVLPSGVSADVYAWSTGDTTPSITILNTSGVDTVQKIWLTVVDSLGFTASDTILLSVPAGVPGVTATLDNNVNCNGDSTGQASAIATGGQGILAYEWSTNPVQTTAVATGLPAGSYNVTVVDENGCEATSSVTVSEPTALDAVLDSVSNALCAGDANGSISVTVSGGTAPYSYLWSNGSTSEDLTNLAAGVYTGTVTDSLGCTLASPSIVVDEPDSIAVALDAITNVVCPDDTDGSITISVSGGTAPYSFLWSNGDTTEDLTNVGVGAYSGTLTDANGCTFSSPTLTITNTDSLPAAAFDYGTVGAAVNFSNTTPNGTSYIWAFGDGDSSTLENPTHLYATNDQFIVSLTVTNNCGTTTITDTVLITQVGIEDDLLAAHVSIYPNPTHGAFDIKFDQISLDEAEVVLATVEGKLIVKEKIGNVRGVFTHRMNLSENLARGVYVLRIVTNQGVIHKRIQLE